jgi:hypothetical protein
MSTRSGETLLHALVHERHLTVPETLKVLQRRAARMSEPAFALSDRQFRRWLAGDISSLDGARPANVRVAEAEFGWSIGALLAADERQLEYPMPLTHAVTQRKLHTDEFISWIAAHSSLMYEAAYASVAERVERAAEMPPSLQAAQEHDRRRVTRADIADCVSDHYGADFYSAVVGRFAVRLSVLAGDAWTGLRVPLGRDAENCHVDRSTERPAIRLNEREAGAALGRLAAAEVAGTVLTNDPIYSLTSLELGDGCLQAGFSCAEFADYALTGDLLEQELRDQLRDRAPGAGRTPGPLRAAWLPTLEVALKFDERVCAGGPVCLLAIADGEQYQLLVQERSHRVLNVAGALAVIPKAFHQPIVDSYGEVNISTTVERELEEELLGRPDLEQLSDAYARRAAPMHPAAAPPAMHWLQEHPDAWQMECTGFGINMVTGTYEFACLVAVHDPTWWTNYGHMLEANWEAKRLRRYSSLDGAGIEQLVSDPTWSNEGLFGFIEGLRRLDEFGSPQVRVPTIERTQ